MKRGTICRKIRNGKTVWWLEQEPGWDYGNGCEEKDAWRIDSGIVQGYRHGNYNIKLPDVMWLPDFIALPFEQLHLTEEAARVALKEKKDG